MSGYALLIPELLVLVGAAWALFAEKLPGGDRGSAWVGATAAFVAACICAVSPLGDQLFGGALVFDGPARFARAGVAALGGLWLLWVAGRRGERMREAVALALFTTLGSMLMVAARDLVTLILAVELSTMPAYVLMGYDRKRIAGLEGALKYFLLSVMTSLIMIYGMSFLYGVTGSTRYSALDLSAAGPLGPLAVLLTFIGLFAKISAAPFHYWAPDAYEGAESWAVAFVSTVPKLSGVVAAVLLAGALAPSASILGDLLLVAAVASMVLGNLSALNQTDIRRMMAYSGVAHVGYLLLAASVTSGSGFGAAAFYALAYAVPSLGIMLVVAENGPKVEDLGGLAARRPAVAWGLVAMLLSLIGIPPFVGFFGKLGLFTSFLKHGAVAWVVIAVMMSVVSAGYYLRLVRSAFFGEQKGEAALAGSPASSVAIAVCVAATLALGLFAGPLTSWIAW